MDLGASRCFWIQEIKRLFCKIYFKDSYTSSIVHLYYYRPVIAR